MTQTPLARRRLPLTPRRWRGWLMLPALSASMGCEADGAEPRTQRQDAPAAATTARSEPETKWDAPVRVLEAEGSAFAARLFADREATYVLAPNAAYRLVPSQPVTRLELELGATSTLMGEQIVFWRGGALAQVDKNGATPSRLSTVAQQPQHLLSSQDRLAWSEVEPGSTFAWYAYETPQPRLLWSGTTDVVAATMSDDGLYFVERGPTAQWRVTLVSLVGNPTSSGAWNEGRPPAMLTYADALYYYDGPTRSVRRLSPDLAQETVVANKVICSPLAIATYVFCAQPGNLVILRRDGSLVRELPLPDIGAITALSASENSVTWLFDRGSERFGVARLDIDDAH